MSTGLRSAINAARKAEQSEKNGFTTEARSTQRFSFQKFSPRPLRLCVNFFCLAKKGQLLLAESRP